ncbi:hypothetical protein ACX9MO_05175 [Pseudooceanicola sp. 502str34]
MALDFTNAPTLPSLNDPATFNERALALFAWLTGTHINELEAITAADFIGLILGTVSLSGGVPTGAIFERGSNANGEYVKFADGTMICFSPTFTSGSIATAAGNVYRDSSSISWTYPATFTSMTTSLNVCASLSNVNCWPATQAGSTTAACYVMSHLNTQTAVPVRFFAIGRWA